MSIRHSGKNNRRSFLLRLSLSVGFTLTLLQYTLLTMAIISFALVLAIAVALAAAADPRNPTTNSQFRQMDEARSEFMKLLDEYKASMDDDSTPGVLSELLTEMAIKCNEMTKSALDRLKQNKYVESFDPLQREGKLKEFTDDISSNCEDLLKRTAERLQDQKAKQA